MRRTPLRDGTSVVRRAIMGGDTGKGEEEIKESHETDSPLPSPRRRSKDEWIDGREMMRIIAQKEDDERRQREYEEGSERYPMMQDSSWVDARYGGPSSSPPTRSDAFVSRVDVSDADTLQIELPSPGMNSNSLFGGAFAAVWFSAIAPATFARGGAPLLFLAPFWLAGGMVAKTALYDPFVSSSLSIGRYAWSVERRYLQKLGKLISAKREEGSTEMLGGASVELVIVVNGVPQYEIQLYSFRNDGELVRGIASFGRGLDIEELQYLAGMVNNHLQSIRVEIE